MKSIRTRALPAVVVLSVAAVALALVGGAAADGDSGQRADVVGQGLSGPVVSEDGAKLVRTAHHLRVKLRMPTPEPGSYVYPGPNPWHPNGTSPGSPEVFTFWVIVFNYPALCSGPCDADDLGDTPAKGGVFGVDGLIASRSHISFAGKIRGDTTPFAGSPLLEPETATVHFAVAPHGGVDPGNIENQLTKPVGSPPMWWLAIFD